MKEFLNSPLFTIVCASIAFILLIIAGSHDTSVPDMIATEAQHNAWVAEHGTDQSTYYKFMIGSAVSCLFAIYSYFNTKTV